MFCTKCGANVVEGMKFCTGCGADVSQMTSSGQTEETKTDAPATEQPVNQQPVYQQPVYQQPVYQQPVYQQPVYQPVVTAPKKKRHTGLIITLVVLAVLIGGAAYVLGSVFSWFGPKNIGGSYTQADFNSMIQKLGLHITADLGNGETYDNAPILSGDSKSKADSTIKAATLKKKLSIHDYNWSFSNYQPKSVTLTVAEANAFFNEIAPSFWWFDKTHVIIDKNGKIISSSKVDIKKIKAELYPDVAGDIPIPLPSSLNLYTEGDFSITNNQIDMVPDVIKAGPISIPEQYTGGDNLDIFEDYLARFFTIIPDMQINYAGAKNGEFVFDGTIPTEVAVTPKN